MLGMYESITTKSLYILYTYTDKRIPALLSAEAVQCTTDKRNPDTFWNSVQYSTVNKEHMYSTQYVRRWLPLQYSAQYVTIHKAYTLSAVQKHGYGQKYAHAGSAQL